MTLVIDTGHMQRLAPMNTSWINTMAADDMAMQGRKASAAMIWT